MMAFTRERFMELAGIEAAVREIEEAILGGVSNSFRNPGHMSKVNDVAKIALSPPNKNETEETEEDEIDFNVENL